MEKQLLIARMLAGAFFVLLLISLGFTLSMHKQLETAQASQGFAVAHDRINQDCAGPKGTQAPACQADLQDLSSTLSQFAKAIGVPSATTTASTTVTK